MIDIEERPIADAIDGVPDPSKCTILSGHDSALEQMFENYRSGRMHHAWLLSGPRGIGKASMAMMWAKFLFSYPDRRDLPPPPAQFDPGSIGEDIHRQVAQGAHPQLLHLTRPWDEKTKRFKTQLSVEEIRRTQHFYGMTAGAGGWRVTIVDSIDDMNASAANALLKILEEPPKKSLFFVLSHATGRPLATIKSRCQQLTLQPLSDDQNLAVINRLGVQASDADKQKAVELSEGSVRRTIQLLESTVMKDFSVFESLMKRQATGDGGDWKAVHKIADSLSRRGQEEAYGLFKDLVTGWIGAQVRSNQQVALSELAGWAELWDKANRSSTLAEAFNLDKKQVILSLFGDLFERNRRG
ncbi:MAG: DNA polymerase III subunit delta' [Rhizobiaceae bacterium]